MDRKVALVTGASRGIGRATARRLAERGCFVAIGFAQHADAAAETLKLVAETGAGGELLPFDVSSPESCASAVEGILARHGRIDVLVNNAGLISDALIVRQKDEDWNRLLAVNLTGPMALCRAAARPMMKQRSGAIVNVASISGEMGNGGQSAYAASKAGLLGMTKSLARELSSRGIRVNAVSPGFIETDMTAELATAVRERILSQVPLGRLGSADEVARAIAFLASDEASYITGEVLRVNGGLLT
jgi:3-oxoacyl-[acyl-carrier protein] reductase